MATTLTVSSISSGVSWNFEDGNTFGSSTNNNSFAYRKSMTNGTGASSANVIYVVQDETGITTSGSTTIDLRSLTDMFDNSVTLTKVKEVYLENTSTTTGVDILMGAAATSVWAASDALMTTTNGTVLVPAGACVHFTNPNAAGWATTTTSRNLKLANASGTYAATYKLVLIGE